MAIAFDLACLAANPDNLALRRDAMKRIVRLKEAVGTENAESRLNWSQNDIPQQHEAEHRPPQIGRTASPVVAFVFGFLFVIYWNPTMANRSEPIMTGSIETVNLAPSPTKSEPFSWVTQTD